VNHVSLFGGHHDVWTVVTPVGQGASAFAIDKIEMVNPIKRISLFIRQKINIKYPTLVRFRKTGLVHRKTGGISDPNFLNCIGIEKY